MLTLEVYEHGSGVTCYTFRRGTTSVSFDDAGCNFENRSDIVKLAEMVRASMFPIDESDGKWGTTVTYTF
jgi:hypothetical protein